MVKANAAELGVVAQISYSALYKNLEDRMTVSSTGAEPEEQLQAYIEKYVPEHETLFRSVRSAVRERVPTANEFVYDYKTFIVIAYSPTDRPTDGILSLAARPDGVRLYLTNGPELPDPKKLLQGSGKQVRFIRVEAASQLAHPDVEALIAAAIDRARVPLPSEGRGKLIIWSAK